MIREGSSWGRGAGLCRPASTFAYGTGYARAVLWEAQYRLPLARRPYDLRHAAVSTWLNGGVAPTQVAGWAGHSVGVLLQVYAKCLDGQEAVALDRVERALGLAR
jgi:integrase